MPSRRLVGFDKVFLKAGEKRRVQLTIDPAASNHPLSVWDTDADTWHTPSGNFEVRVRSSSGHPSFVETDKQTDKVRQPRQR